MHNICKSNCRRSREQLWAEQPARLHASPRHLEAAAVLASETCSGGRRERDPMVRGEGPVLCLGLWDTPRNGPVCPPESLQWTGKRE